MRLRWLTHRGERRIGQSYESSYPAQAGYPVRRGFSVQSLLSLEYWVTRPSAQLRTRRVTTTEYVFAISRRVAPEACMITSRPLVRGRREDRVHAAPAVSCAVAHRRRAHEHTGSAETLRPSLRNGFTAYFELSPVNGSFATVAPKKLASQELDASTAASGPHDFAVRVGRLRLARLSRPPHLTARS